MGDETIKVVNTPAWRKEDWLGVRGTGLKEGGLVWRKRAWLGIY